MESTLTFAEPGPGGWDLDRSHYAGATTPISIWLMEESCEAGMRRAFAEFGVPADTLQVRFVNGFMYTRLRPLVAPNRAATKVPPAPVLKLASRVHPEFRRRTKAAARTLADRPWRRVVAEWTATIQPGLERTNLRFQDTDVASLDDGALASHLEEVLAHVRRTFEQHFYLHAFDLGPIGMLLYESKPWGLSTADVVPALEAASPSTGEPGRALDRIRAALRGPTPPASLEELRAVSPEVSEALDDYLRLRGSVMFSRYDLEGLTLNEAPEVLLATVLNGAAMEHAAADEQKAAEVGMALRARVPAEHRVRFDSLLAEARAAMDLRDNNGPNTVQWPVGLLRRALLEAGRRLTASGRILDPVHLFELEPTEVSALVRTGAGPSATDLVARRKARLANAAATPPAHLGPVEPKPPLSALPLPLATMVGVVNSVIAEMGLDASAPTGIGLTGRAWAPSPTGAGRGWRPRPRTP